MMIEDEELRDIFKTASVEHIQKIEHGLMHLEKHPQDRAKLDEVMREAHTLKGDARMLGVEDVSTLVHQIEEFLGAFKRGESVLTSELCDRLYQGIDAIRQLSHEAVTGEAADVNLFSVLAQLMGAETEADHEEPLAETEFDLFDDDLFPDEPAAAPPEPSEAIAESVAEAPPNESATAQVNDYQIDTIRVEPQKLDALLRQAGELSVTKLRIAHWSAEIAEIISLWEEWNREAFINRSALDRLEKQIDSAHLQQVQKFSHRAERRLERLGELVNRLRNAATDDTAQLEKLTNDLETGIQSLRLLPLSTIFNLFPRMVRDLAKQQGKEINLVIEGGDTKADKRVLEEMKDPLMHILRNAIDHGIETPQERDRSGKPRTATLRLRGYQLGSRISIEVSDDGRGLDVESIKQTALRRGVCSSEQLSAMTPEQIQSLIFAPGFSTRTSVSEISGRGVGLDVVRANVERLKGAIEVESSPGQGCRFSLKLNTTLATTHVLVVEVNRTAYAIPIEFVQTMMLLSRQEIFALEGRQTITLNEQPVSVVWLADLLELPVNVPSSPQAADATAKALPCMILQVGSERLGLLVDAFTDEQDVVLKPQSKLLKRVRNVFGATILGTGEVCMILNPQDMIKSVRGHASATTQIVETKTKTSILLVEDSIIIRTQLKRLLEGAGYQVTVAVDGLDGFNKLKMGTFDAVVSDVEMPNLSGLELTAKVRQYSEYSELPIILVTTLASDEDKRRGAEAGANAYLTKGSFEQKLLIDTLQRLV